MGRSVIEIEYTEGRDFKCLVYVEKLEELSRSSVLRVVNVCRRRLAIAMGLLLYVELEDKI